MFVLENTGIITYIKPSTTEVIDMSWVNILNDILIHNGETNNAKSEKQLNEEIVRIKNDENMPLFIKNVKLHIIDQKLSALRANKVALQAAKGCNECDKHKQ